MYTWQQNHNPTLILVIQNDNNNKIIDLTESSHHQWQRMREREGERAEEKEEEVERSQHTRPNKEKTEEGLAPQPFRLFLEISFP